MSVSEIERVRAICGFEFPKNEIQEESAEPALLSVVLKRCGRMAELAGIKVHEAKRMFLISLSASLCLIALAVIAGSIWMCIPAILVLYIPSYLLRRKSQRRLDDFDRDYTTFLLAISSSIRTGLDPLTAVMSTERLFQKDSEVARVLQAFKNDIESSASEELAIERFAADVAHPDVELFRAALKLSTQHGSSLAVCLERLAKVTRQRQAFRRKVKSSLALQRLSALGIVACTIIISLIQFTTNRESVLAAMSHPVGGKILALGLLLICCGVFWMFRLGKRSVSCPV